MTHNWIIDVLADLRTFAMQNDMPTLGEQLGDTMLVAAAEMAQIAEIEGGVRHDAVEAGRLPGRPEAGEHAC